MQPKPESFSATYAETFKEQQVVEAYQYRPSYPDEVFSILAALITDEPRTVLDVGSGSGDLAGRLVEVVERVDAVDPSAHMIARGKQLPNGMHPHLQWIVGKVEEVPLASPYALITAESSIHWTQWEVAFPRFHRMLTPHGFLALIYRRTLPMPWEAEVRALHAQFSPRRDHKRPNAVAELEARGLFHRQGEQQTIPVPFVQSIDDFIEGLHSRSQLARERMGEQQATAFDRQVRSLLLQFHPDGVLPLQVVATVTWGRPEGGMAQ
jgi:ubiquinone/menaquinone biosynthesis C-methylase UbiE